MQHSATLFERFRPVQFIMSGACWNAVDWNRGAYHTRHRRDFTMMRATHCIECGPTVIRQMLEATMAASSWPLRALKRSGTSPGS